MPESPDTLLEHTTPQSVVRTIAALEADADALGRNPCRGTRRDEIAHGLRAIPSAGKGVIAFEVREETADSSDPVHHLGWL